MASDPFPITAPLNPNFAGGDKLVKLLKKKIAESATPRAFDHLGIALVDLTKSSSSAPAGSVSDYAGINDTVEHRAFSLAKISIMFAGYRLRERVRLGGKGLAAKSAGEVFAQLTADWKSKVETKVPEVRRDFPQFQDIFKVTGASGAWTFNFTE